MENDIESDIFIFRFEKMNGFRLGKGKKIDHFKQDEYTSITLSIIHFSFSYM